MSNYNGKNYQLTIRNNKNDRVGTKNNNTVLFIIIIVVMNLGI